MIVVVKHVGGDFVGPKLGRDVFHEIEHRSIGRRNSRDLVRHDRSLGDVSADFDKSAETRVNAPAVRRVLVLEPLLARPARRLAPDAVDLQVRPVSIRWRASL